MAGGGTPVTWATLPCSGIRAPLEKFFPDYLAPAGALNGSIGDLVKWEMALSGSNVITASSLEAMTTPYRLRDGKPGVFGLGFTMTAIGQYPTVSYEGGAAAWRLAVPVDHLTVIVLTNLQGISPEELATGIARIYDPKLTGSLGLRRSAH